MFENFKLTDSFTPFMLGSISLIAFLSVRNGFLATKTREICKELISAEDDLWQWSFILQLKFFVHRYKFNNLALMAAILSVFLFGLMIAFTDLFQIHVSFDLNRSGSSILLILGGLSATFATVISIYETFKGRNSLFAYVATTLVKLKITDSKYPITTNIITIEQEIKNYLPHNLQDELSKILINIKK